MGSIRFSIEKDVKSIKDIEVYRIYGKQGLLLLILAFQSLLNLEATKFGDSIAKHKFHHLATELI